MCVRVDACVCETERESFQSFIVSLLSYIGPESAKLVFLFLKIFVWQFDKKLYYYSHSCFKHPKHH